MSLVVHPKYRDTLSQLEACMLGIFGETFRAQHDGRDLKVAFSPHELAKLTAVIHGAALTALRGYVDAFTKYRSMERRRESRAKKRNRRKP